MTNHPIASAQTVAWFHPVSGIAGDMTLGALLDAGADPDVVNNQAKTPLDLAISGSKDEIIDLLLEAGASVEPPVEGIHVLSHCDLISST